MFVAALLAATVLAGCGSDLAADPAWIAAKQPVHIAPQTKTLRLLFVGDVMLGRSVAPIVAADPEGIFSNVRHVVAQADLAMFNLESPLTHRSHEAETPNVLEADPAAAAVLAAAGFDVAAVANNHSGDAGIAGMRDTVAALADSGIRTIGAGPDGATAAAALLVDAETFQVAMLAFDLTWQGPAAGDEPGLAEWDMDSVAAAVAAAREAADVVVVGIHGGIEYRTEADDPIVDPAISQLARLGVDVVWGHGPHVVQPIRVVASEDGGTVVAASSLGNFLFDQRSGATGSGAVLEVLVDADGVIAYRSGVTDHSDLRVTFLGWAPPAGDAVVIGGEWWELVRALDWSDSARTDSVANGFPHGDVFDALEADITGDGLVDVVVSYRYPFRETLANRGNEEFYADSQGRAAHFGIFEPGTWRKTWAAGTVQRPIETLQACDGVLGFGYSTLDEPGVVATGGAVWGGFGFTFLSDLEGAAELRCSDADGDGTLDLVVTR